MLNILVQGVQYGGGGYSVEVGGGERLETKLSPHGRL